MDVTRVESGFEPPLSQMDCLFKIVCSRLSVQDCLFKIVCLRLSVQDGISKLSGKPIRTKIGLDLLVYNPLLFGGGGGGEEDRGEGGGCNWREYRYTLAVAIDMPKDITQLRVTITAHLTESQHPGHSILMIGRRLSLSHVRVLLQLDRTALHCYMKRYVLQLDKTALHCYM